MYLRLRRCQANKHSFFFPLSQINKQEETWQSCSSKYFATLIANTMISFLSDHHVSQSLDPKSIPGLTPALGPLSALLSATAAFTSNYTRAGAHKRLFQAAPSSTPHPMSPGQMCPEFSLDFHSSVLNIANNNTCHKPGTSGHSHFEHQCCYNSVTQSVVHRPAATALPGILSEIQNPGEGILISFKLQLMMLASHTRAQIQVLAALFLI